MVGHMLFRWCRNPCTSPFLRMQHVSSTCCFHNRVLTWKPALHHHCVVPLVRWQQTSSTSSIDWWRGVHWCYYSLTWNTSEGACERMHQRLHGQICYTCVAEVENNPIHWQHAGRTMELIVKEAMCTRMTPESSHFSGYDIANWWIAAH